MSTVKHEIYLDAHQHKIRLRHARLYLKAKILSGRLLRGVWWDCFVVEFGWAQQAYCVEAKIGQDPPLGYMSFWARILLLQDDELCMRNNTVVWMRKVEGTDGVPPLRSRWWEAEDLFIPDANPIPRSFTPPHPNYKKGMPDGRCNAKPDADLDALADVLPRVSSGSVDEDPDKDSDEETLPAFDLPLFGSQEPVLQEEPVVQDTVPDNAMDVDNMAFVPMEFSMVVDDNDVDLDEEEGEVDQLHEVGNDGNGGECRDREEGRGEGGAVGEGPEGRLHSVRKGTRGVLGQAQGGHVPPLLRQKGTATTRAAYLTLVKQSQARRLEKYILDGKVMKDAGKGGLRGGPSGAAASKASSSAGEGSSSRGTVKEPKGKEKANLNIGSDGKKCVGPAALRKRSLLHGVVVESLDEFCISIKGQIKFTQIKFEGVVQDANTVVMAHISDIHKQNLELLKVVKALEVQCGELKKDAEKVLESVVLDSFAHPRTSIRVAITSLRPSLASRLLVYLLVVIYLLGYGFFGVSDASDASDVSDVSDVSDMSDGLEVEDDFPSIPQESGHVTTDSSPTGHHLATPSSLNLGDEDSSSGGYRSTDDLRVVASEGGIRTWRTQCTSCKN
ncbi:hypothetical protein OF83DRAFT_1089407, partial [Amylostereum chailletii]